jgi:hypothetical protein
MTSPVAAPTVAAPDGPAARPSTSLHSGDEVRTAWLGRLLGAATWMVMGKLLGLWLTGLPVVSLLGTTSVTFVTGALLFGWIGVAMAALAQLGYLGLLEGFGSTYTWVSTVGYTAAAALAWLTFRYVPGLSRRFHDARTVAWFAVAGAAGGLLSSGLITLFGDHVENLWQQAALWSRSTVASVWVFSPAVVLLAERALRPWMASIPGEPRPASPRRVALVRSSLAGQPLQVVDVETRELGVGRVLGRGVAAVAAITAAKLLFADSQADGYDWWNLLYLVPIWWLARVWRLPGALLGAGLVSAAALGSDAALTGGDVAHTATALAVYAQLLVFLFVAVLLGSSGEREGRLLEGLADLHERLEQDLQRVVKALTGAAAAKDEYTEGHLQRVNAYALEVGRRLGLGNPELELLQIASTLHDIGKIGIPEQILNKEGPLSASERDVMQRHPEIGARLLSRIDGLRAAAPFVLHHQERWDGARDGQFPGYPSGLRGEEIPLGARIIAVVDAFDAMTTDRPYRGALSEGEAREALRAERGRQFDPRVVEVFLTLLDDRPWQ